MNKLQADIRILLGVFNTLNFHRLLNLLLLYFSYLLSIAFKKPIFLSSLPSFISVEPSGNCNLKCPECPTGMNSLSRPKGNMDFEFFKKIIEEIRKKTFYLNLYFQGEPMLNKEIVDFIKYAHQRRLYICCSTNANKISEKLSKELVLSGLDQLIISVDGTTPEEYQKYRIGGDFEAVKTAIGLLNKQKKIHNQKYPLIVMQFLIFKHNEHKINEAKKMAKELGVDKLVFKRAQLYNLSTENPFLPENNTYSRYKRMPDESLKLKKELKKRCWKSWSSCVITWDGKVVPCCFDKNADYSYGTIGKTKLSEILREKRATEFKNRILHNRKEIDICCNCS